MRCTRGPHAAIAASCAPGAANAACRAGGGANPCAPARQKAQDDADEAAGSSGPESCAAPLESLVIAAAEQTAANSESLDRSAASAPPSVGIDAPKSIANRANQLQMRRRRAANCMKADLT